MVESRTARRWYTLCTRKRAQGAQQTVAVTDVSTITLAAQPALLGACGLCGRAGGGLPAVVAVTHGGGTVARFDVCEFCDRALRRLEAVTPGFARLAIGVAVNEPAREALPVDELVGPVVLIQEFQQPIQDGDGALYVPVAVGVQRGDGTWAGWLEFREVGGARVLQTNRETTQPNHGALAYWASGLQPSYIEGAFRRAKRPHTVRVP